jgi:UDP-glucose 4-epimerase
VAVLDDLSSGKVEYLNPQAKFYHLTITEAKLMWELMEQEKFDYIFHLAAQISVPLSVEDPIADMEVNVKGSYNVFKSALDSNVKKVIFISTGGALYGDVTEPAHEAFLVQPISPYAIHKFTAERYLEFFRHEKGLNSIILRLANVYGPRQFKGGEGAAVAVFTHNTLNSLKSNVYGDGQKTRDYCYVGDVVEACVKAMASEYQGVLNIGTSNRISVLDLITTIEQVSKTKAIYEHVGDRPGDVQDSVLSNSLAKEILAWEPKTSLEDGIEKTLAWVMKK